MVSYPWFLIIILSYISNTYQIYVPPGIVNQTTEEFNYLRYHRCYDGGEIYSAAYMITREHLIKQNTNYSLNWVNCEMASFIMYTSTIGIQSLDILDYSVIHLSAYERLHRSWKSFYKLNPKVNTLEVMRQVTSYVKHQTMQNSNNSKLSLMDRTLVVMPFLGTGMGAGHSILENRFAYLHACVWSIYEHFTHIVVGVLSESDYNYTKYESGLPIYDVILMENLPKSASLPVATVQAVKRNFISRKYDFDYMYFTESDQILLLRRPQEIYKLLMDHPRYIVTPHRLMPYPESVFKAKLAATTKVVHLKDKIYGWRDQICCMNRQNCQRRITQRKHWVDVSHSSVPVIEIYGLFIPLGNSDFLHYKYHACHFFEDKKREDTIRLHNGICP